MRWCLYSWSVLIPILLAQATKGVLVNQTIDDNLGDSLTGFKVQYAPLRAPAGELVWKSQDECDDCAIKPDREGTNNKTWTSATYYGSLGNVTAAMRFQGTAIYIYLVVSNYPNSTGLISAVQCRFRLDGALVGSYAHPSDESYKFQYNTLAFSRAGLANASHDFVIEMSGASTSSYLIFDYAQYTTDVTSPSVTTSAKTGPTSTALIDTSSNKSTTPVGAIVGGVVGGIAFLALILLGILLCRRRRRKRERIHLNSPPRPAVLDLHSGHVAPFMATQLADLEHQLLNKRRTMETLQSQKTHTAPLLSGRTSATGDSDLRQQMEELRTQMRRVESQQRLSATASASDPGWVSAGAGASSVSGSSSPLPATRSLSTMKREQTRVVTNQSANADAENTLVHTDSGLRLTAGRSGLIELPPTYAPE